MAARVADRRKVRLGTALAGVLATLQPGPVAPAHASFTIAPTVIDVGRDRGGAAVGTFTVWLNGERGRRFSVEVEDAQQDMGGAFKFRPQDGSRRSASAWISVAPHEFRGQGDRVQPVEFRVRVPRDAEPGDHLTSITVKRLAEAGGGSAAVAQALAVRLTVRVRGALRQGVELRGLRVRGVTGEEPVTGAVTVVNTGNTRLDFDGADYGALTVVAGTRARTRLPFTGVLYPGQVREFRLSWPDPPAIGRFAMRARVHAGRRTVTATRAFWLLPWRQGAAMLLVVLGAVVLFRGRAGRRRRAP
jgi:hypothetical protein